LEIPLSINMSPVYFVDIWCAWLHPQLSGIFIYEARICGILGNFRDRPRWCWSYRLYW